MADIVLDLQINAPHITAQYDFPEPPYYSTVNFTFTCDKGFKIDTSQNFAIGYTDSTYDSFTWARKDQFNFLNNDTVAKITLHSVSIANHIVLNGTTIEGSPVPPQPAYTIENKIANSSYEATEQGDQITIKVNAADGFVFGDDVKLTYHKDFEQTGSKNATLSNEKKTATISISKNEFETGSVLTLSGSTTSDHVVTVENQITNATFVREDVGGMVKITVNANDGYTLKNDVKANYKNNDGTQTSNKLMIDDAKKHAVTEIGLSSILNNSVVTLTGSTEQEIKNTVENLATGCTLSEQIKPSYEKGETVRFTLVANDGRKFEKIPFARWTDKVFGKGGSERFTLSNDHKTATIDFTFPADRVILVEIIGETVIAEPVGETYGSINVYKVTNDDLDQLAKKRFFRAGDPDPETGRPKFEEMDVANYIYSVKRVYVAVQDGQSDTLKTGNYDTGIVVHEPQKVEFELNFGTVTIPYKNNDLTDYQTEIKLYLPFYGFINIPVDYMGRDLTLTYKINLITGKGVALVYDGDLLVLLVDVDVSQSIIYRTAFNQLQMIENSQITERYLYGFAAFVEIRYFDSLNLNLSNNTCRRAAISEFTGVNSFTDLSDLNTGAMLKEEQSEIINRLQSGINIEQ